MQPHYISPLSLFLLICHIVIIIVIIVVEAIIPAIKRSCYSSICIIFCHTAQLNVPPADLPSHPGE